MRTLIRCLRSRRPLWHLWVASGLVIALIVPGVLLLPLIERHLIDEVLLSKRLDLLLPTVAAYGAVWLAISIAQVLGSTLRAYLDERVSLDLRRQLFAHCEALSVPFWHREHSGRTMSLFSSDVSNLTGFIGSGLVMGFGQLLTLLAGALVMFHLSLELALIVMVVPPILAGLATLLTRPIRWAARQAQDKAAELNAQLHENLAGLREIAAFAQERAQGARYAAALHDLLRLRMRLAYMGAAIGAGQSVFSLALTVALLGGGGYLVITGQTTLGTVLAMQQIYAQIYPTAMALVGMVIGAQRVLASADRIFEMLDQKPRVQERPGAHDPERCRGVVEFESVTFSYTADRPVLRDVSFAARPGEMIALIGPSGAGKSTLAGLIARFYDPDEGRVLLDGVDLRDLTLTGLRGMIGMVSQDPFLFATTIRENIALGREGATEAEIVAAARSANAWEFIERLPAGLDTQVGQRAVQVSEGQKQRLAIARALLREPRILILDEPTSALDARSEHLLREALERLMHGRTTFVIAHRLATVRRADRILLVDDGRIVEQGTHAELLRRGGLYRELHDFQFGGQEPPGDPDPVAPEPLVAAAMGRD